MDFDIASFLTWYIVLIVALVVHEAAHAWVALLGGDRTAYEAGQVTINPIPHMQREPIGTILLPIVSFYFWGWPLGFAHAPYNPYWAEAHPKRAAWMSAAGPLANLAIATLMFAIMKVGMAVDWFDIPIARAGFHQRGLETIVAAEGWAESGTLATFAKICSVMFSMNLILGVFNLIPMPPLDGAGIAEGLLPGPLGSLYRHLRSNQTFALLGMILAWYYAIYLIMPPWYWAVGLIHG